ncbi:MAG: ROK family protein [Prevotella sp.]|nr:ROK family protein [Prevotella sp.]
MIETATKDKVIGIDISLERTTYAIVDIRGNILASGGFRTSDYPVLNDYVAVLCEHIVNLMMDNNAFESIRSVGISAPSGNYKTGCIENSPNMPWKGVIPMAAMLRDRIGLAVALGNDSHVIALGEHAFGSAHGMSDFAIVTLGHGLGSAFFSQRQFHLGADGFAGELGHTCIEEGGRLCECGLRGCLEAYCAEKGIIRTAKDLMEASDAPSLMRDLDHLSPRTIVDCCEQGDEMAIEVFRRTGEYFGRGLATYASIIDPEAIIIAGGISKAGKWLMEPTEESFNRHVFRNIRGKVRLIVSSLNDRERDVLGASALAWDVKEYSLFK